MRGDADSVVLRCTGRIHWATFLSINAFPPLAGLWQIQDQHLVDQVIKSAASPAVGLGANASCVLLGKSIEQLSQLCADLGHPKYRGKQIHDALMHGADAVNDLNLVRRVAAPPLLKKNPTCKQGHQVGAQKGYLDIQSFQMFM